MKRTVRAVTTLALTLALSGLTGAGIAGAQEMEHGRTRPTYRAATTNQVKTQDAALQGYAGYIKG